MRLRVGDMRGIKVKGQRQGHENRALIGLSARFQSRQSLQLDNVSRAVAVKGKRRLAPRALFVGLGIALIAVGLALTLTRSLQSSTSLKRTAPGAKIRGAGQPAPHAKPYSSRKSKVESALLRAARTYIELSGTYVRDDYSAWRRRVDRLLAPSLKSGRIEPPSLGSRTAVSHLKIGYLRGVEADVVLQLKERRKGGAPIWRDAKLTLVRRRGRWLVSGSGGGE